MPMPLALAVALSLPSAAAADPGALPPLKPGLWTTTITSDGREPVGHRTCVGAGAVQQILRATTDQQTRAMGQGMTPGKCSQSDLRRDGDGLAFASVCPMGPTTMRTTGRIAFTGDSAFRSELTATFDPQLMGLSKAGSVAVSKYSGACPAGMKPGELRLHDGRTIVQE